MQTASCRAVVLPPLAGRSTSEAGVRSKRETPGGGGRRGRGSEAEVRRETPGGREKGKGVRGRGQGGEKGKGARGRGQGGGEGEGGQEVCTLRTHPPPPLTTEHTGSDCLQLPRHALQTAVIIALSQCGLQELGVLLVPFLQGRQSSEWCGLQELGVVLLPFLQDRQSSEWCGLQELGVVLLPFLQGRQSSEWCGLQELGVVLLPFLQGRQSSEWCGLQELGVVLLPFLQGRQSSEWCGLQELGVVLLPFLQGRQSSGLQELGVVLLPFLQAAEVRMATCQATRSGHTMPDHKDREHVDRVAGTGGYWVLLVAGTGWLVPGGWYQVASIGCVPEVMPCLPGSHTAAYCSHTAAWNAVVLWLGGGGGISHILICGCGGT